MHEMNLPEHWNEIKLSNQQLFSFENGIWKGKKEPFEECAVVRNTNFTSDGYLDLTDVAVLPIEQRYLDKKKLKWGDIVIERSGGGPKQPVGRVVFFNLNDGKYCFSNFTSRLRVIDKNTIHPIFLFFYLLYFHDSGQTRKLQKRTTGIRNLIFGDYKESTIPLPPLPEQRAIAHVLQTIQEAKFTRQREIELEYERKAALMDVLFSHGTKGEPRKQTEIGEIPESWEAIQIGEIGEVITGNTPKTSVPEYYGGPYMFISPGDISDPQYVTKTNKYISDEGLKVSRVLPRDSVLVVCIGSTIGKTAMTSAEQSATNQQINAIISNPKAFSHYVYYAVTYRSRFLFSLAGRAAVPIVKKSIFTKFLIPLPTLSEQRVIAEILQAIDEKTAALKKEVEHLNELFHAMLDELMTGQRSAVPLIDTEMDL